MAKVTNANRNSLATGVCSNIQLFVHVAHSDWSASMTHILNKASFRWLIVYRRAQNHILQEGYELALDLAFDSKLLRSICENEDEAIRELGPSAAKSLKHRLADLRAAVSITDLLVGSPKIVEDGKDRQRLMVDLYDGYHILFSANHPENPVTADGKVDWQKVSRIKVLQIKRNHD